MQRELDVREAKRQRLFLTYAPGDLARARPVAARLTCGGAIVLDEAQISGPFEGARGDIIRASLLARLGHCVGALCLYGDDTAGDLWVRWMLRSAAELRLPLLGAALPGERAHTAEGYLTRLGAVIVRADGDDIVAAARSLPTRQFGPSLDASQLAETLHLMRHPLR